MDRCEVCQRVIVARPDPKRRRCADHLAQLVLVPMPRKSAQRKSRKSTNDSTGEGSR